MVRCGPAAQASWHTRPMLKAIVAALLVISVAAAWKVMRTPLRPPPPPREATGPAPNEGRATLDHAGQPAVSLPSDPKVEVTN